MPKDDALDPFEEELKKQHDAAMNALRFFIDQYSPAASKNAADVFYTTAEIGNAIYQHTGTRLSNADIFEMMSNMQYKYEAINGLEFTWLLKKEN